MMDRRDEIAARRFIQERGPWFHPALGVASSFNEKILRFELTEIQ